MSDKQEECFSVCENIEQVNIVIYYQNTIDNA